MGARILVVDDSRAVREALQMVLEMEGWEVETACDGRQALARIAASRPDLIVTDLQMPTMDGRELADRVHAQDRDIPVVFITAGGNARAAAEAHEVAGYLEKPFAPADLISLIDRLLDAKAQCAS